MERHSHTDVHELVSHLKIITNELTELHGDLYWLAMQAQDAKTEQASVAELNVELLTAAKGAVDNMRLLLWNYIEAASVVAPQKVQDGLEAQRLQRVTEYLTLLRERLGVNRQQEPLSFIERISNMMKERLSNRVA